MSLTQALSTALSGLQVNQASISMVASNVANADTPGYTRKVVNQVSIGAGSSIGVRVSDIQRQIDLYIQRQLRVENAGASYADTRAQCIPSCRRFMASQGLIRPDRSTTASPPRCKYFQQVPMIPVHARRWSIARSF